VEYLPRSSPVMSRYSQNPGDSLLFSKFKLAVTLSMTGVGDKCELESFVTDPLLQTGDGRIKIQSLPTPFYLDLNSCSHRAISSISRNILLRSTTYSGL
jgi:hypothetical protein